MNTEEVVANGQVKRPQMVLIYDPATRGFASQIDQGIPTNELIGAIETIKAQLIHMQLTQMAMQNAAQQDRRVQVAQSVPAELIHR
jgi:hypothetical protein